METLIRMLGAVAGFLVLGLIALPAPVAACGGCFAPTEQVTVVTGHRMAVALGATETTLWDQIQYAGEPEDFVWVLPISGEILVELADNAFFEALDETTRVTLQVANPVRTTCPDPCARFGSAPSGSADAGVAGDVTVYGEAVVGPYETATIGSEDPTALISWLQDNGYAVPDSILPTIAHYVDQSMNFAVLRLNPNAGVNQMQPVRVTTPGMNPVFPLRMVAAGVEGSVGLELYIFAEGRTGSSNFPVVALDHDEISYDWADGRFNYGDLYDAAIEDNGGRGWVAEYAQPHSRFAGFIEGYARIDPNTGDYSYDAASEDFDIVKRALTEPFLTKIRTDMDARHLTEDIVLEASLEDTIENFIVVTGETNRPGEPRCRTSCDDPTIMPDFDRPGFATGRGDGLCSVTPGLAGGAWFFAAAIAAAAAAFLSLRRRRRN